MARALTWLPSLCAGTCVLARHAGSRPWPLMRHTATSPVLDSQDVLLAAAVLHCTGSQLGHTWRTSRHAQLPDMSRTLPHAIPTDADVMRSLSGRPTAMDITCVQVVAPSPPCSPHSLDNLGSILTQSQSQQEHAVYFDEAVLDARACLVPAPPFPRTRCTSCCSGPSPTDAERQARPAQQHGRSGLP